MFQLLTFMLQLTLEAFKENPHVHLLVSQVDASEFAKAPNLPMSRRMKGSQRGSFQEQAAKMFQHELKYYKLATKFNFAYTHLNSYSSMQPELEGLLFTSLHS